MFCLKYKDLPRVCGLSYVEENCTIRFQPVPQLMALFKRFAGQFGTSGDGPHMEKAYKIDQFIVPTEHTSVWGFGGQILESPDGSLEVVMVPWKGRGKIVACNLQFLFNAMYLGAEDLHGQDAPKKYHLPFQAGGIESFSTSGEYGHCGCCVVISPTGVQWLKDSRNYKRAIEEVKRILFQSYEKLEGKSIKNLAREFRVVADAPPWFSMSVPGMSCCCMHSDHNYSCSVGEGGMRLVPHNNDNFHQQFTFLAASVRLIEMIDVEINSPSR